MGVLKLHNCTRFQLQYWRSIIGHRTNWVAPGHVGEHKFGAIFTLKVETESDGGTKMKGSRAAVNPNGDYYAYYANSKINIFDKKQFAAAVLNDNNPYVNLCPPHNSKGDDKTSDLHGDVKAEWRQILSYYNRSSATVKVVWKEVVGFEEFVTSHTKVLKSSTTGVDVGMSFMVSTAIAKRGRVAYVRTCPLF